MAMPDLIQCEAHGETPLTYLCSHLVEESYGLGFNREDPSEDDNSPEAWCDNCEIIRVAHNGWSKDAEKLIEIKAVCTGCYERARIRNTRPSVTLDDLAKLRWKCGTCEEWHLGPCLDFGEDTPSYWEQSWDQRSRWTSLPSGDLDDSIETFLDSDYCSIRNESYFVRGVIHLPIIGTADSFRWGVWGSLSRKNFEALIRADEVGGRPESTEMFSWLSTKLPEYPDTLSLKMFAVIQEPGIRPHFRLERADHPLAKEYHEGISPQRVRQLMFRLLPPQPE